MESGNLNSIVCDPNLAPIKFTGSFSKENGIDAEIVESDIGSQGIAKVLSGESNFVIYGDVQFTDVFNLIWVSEFQLRLVQPGTSGAGAIQFGPRNRTYQKRF